MRVLVGVRVGVKELVDVIDGVTDGVTLLVGVGVDVRVWVGVGVGGQLKLPDKSTWHNADVVKFKVPPEYVK